MAEVASPVPVHRVARFSLQCSKEASVTSLESPFKLGPMDELVLPFVPIENLFVYRQPTSSSENELLPIGRLRRALPYLLDHYPHLTGRLQINPATHAPEIARLGTGAELHEAQCNIRLDDLIPSDRPSGRLLVTDLPDCGAALTAPFDPSMDGVCRDPILAIQHTRFACGGVVLGVRLHHIVCDTSGFFQLCRDIAEIYRGLTSSAHPSLKRAPLIRSYLRDIGVLSPQERQNALDYKPTAYYLGEPNEAIAANAEGSTDVTLQRTEMPSRPAITGRVLRFSGNELLELKRLATDPSGRDWVSTFEAVSAYLYQTLYRARIQLLISQGVCPTEAREKLVRGFWTSVNVRDRSRLNLGQNYFPNAIHPVYGVLSHELLADGELWMVTKALHDLIRSVDVEQMEKTSRWLAVQPDKHRIRIGFTFADGNFTVSQWSGFKMYVGVHFDVDGEGDPVHPVLVSPPLTDISRVDALAIILSTDENLKLEADNHNVRPSAVDVNLTLTTPLWSILGKDERFRQYYL
ncbi:transferase [Aspergillus nidulans var. acristatus]